jgi:hypothetical protein
MGEMICMGLPLVGVILFSWLCFDYGYGKSVVAFGTYGLKRGSFESWVAAKTLEEGAGA